jgi:hypothetical protein
MMISPGGPGRPFGDRRIGRYPAAASLGPPPSAYVQVQQNTAKNLLYHGRNNSI